MGWDYFHVEPRQRADAILRREFDNSLNVIDSALVGRTWYAAVERATEPGSVFALVVLTSRASGQYNFGYKAMSEDSHPYYYDCPARLLDKLTSTTNKNALDWRKHCRENSKPATV